MICFSASRDRIPTGAAASRGVDDRGPCNHASFAWNVWRTGACFPGTALTTLGLALSAPSPILYGQPETITATVTPSVASTNVPTGQIQITDNGNSLGGIALSSGTTSLTGTVTITLPYIGTNNIVANYLGDTNFGDSSNTTSFLVNPAVTTTTNLTSSVNPSVHGQSVTLSALVTNTSSSAPVTGVVDFYSGSTLLGARQVLANGTAQLTTSKLPTGTDTLTASFVANADFAGSTTTTSLSQTVNAASTTTVVTGFPNPVSLGQSVTLVASVSANAPGRGMPTGTVTFEEVNGSTTTTLGTGTIGRWGLATFTTNALPIGNDIIEAVYGGDTNFAGSTSPQFTEVVQQATPVVTLSASPTSTRGNPLAVGQSVVITATVSQAPNRGFGQGGGWGWFGGASAAATTTTTVPTPTGSVEFLLNGTVVDTTTLDSSGSASFTFTNLTTGLNDITVQYLGDTNYAAATSRTLKEVVGTPSTTSTDSSSASTSSTSGVDNWYANVGNGVPISTPSAVIGKLVSNVLSSSSATTQSAVQNVFASFDSPVARIGHVFSRF